MKLHQSKYLALVVVAVCLLMVPSSTWSQAVTNPKLQPSGTKEPTSTVLESELTIAERRTYALSLVTTLASEARSYNDFALRARVLARAADTIWKADRDTARSLFRRAWDAAEKGDAEELTTKTKDGAPAMIIGLRRISGRDLRSEVVMLATRRDRILGEEFLSRLELETKREIADSSSASKSSTDSWITPAGTSKRVQLALQFLNDGQIERALEFAGPALDSVTPYAIEFLSLLRGKNAEVADQRFAQLLTRAEFDQTADANTVSGLSSYAFTPGFLVTFSPDGNARWIQQDVVSTTPPNLSPALLSRFFQVTGSILLRPLPPSDQDFTSCGRAGKYLAITRLLPLFDQYAPDSAAALRTQLADLRNQPLRVSIADDSFLLTSGLTREEPIESFLRTLQDRLDRAKTSRERDLIYADAAVTLAHRGDTQAQELAKKIEDPDRATQVRRYVDFQFVNLAIKKRNATEVVRLVEVGQLTRAQRSWAYAQAAKLMADSQRQIAQELLEKAVNEARRIEGDGPDRTLCLIGAARQFMIFDSVRAWEILDEAVKAANSTKEYTGENAQLTFPLMTKSGIRFTSFGSDDFSLTGIFRLITKSDLYRSVDLAKNFKSDAARATAILAVARTMLEAERSVN